MRELVQRNGSCGFCGAPASGHGAVAHANGEDTWTVLADWSEARVPARITRERSGLAYGAGFAGVLYLFHYSLATLVQSGPAWVLPAGLLFVWSLLAPLALALSFAAGLSLDRTRQKSGRLPALFGFFAGWFGIVTWVSRLDGGWLISLVPF